MYSFRDYKKLNIPARSAASRYWGEVIKNKVGATCANQILAAHLSDEITSVPGWSDNYSKFWNRILAGKPVSREFKVNESELILPGTKVLLLHPLWQLLNTHLHDVDSLVKVLKALPYELHSKVIDRSINGKMKIKEKLHSKVQGRLFTLTSIDSLVIWLVLAKKAQLVGDTNRIKILEINILRVYFRLVIMTEFSAITTPLYTLIVEFMEKNDSSSNIGYFNDLPTEILPIKIVKPEKIATTLKAVLQALIDAGIIENTSQSREVFLFSINHSNSHNLIDDLYLLSNGTFNRSCIGKGALFALNQYEKLMGA